MKSDNKIIVFENKKIRRTWYDDDWWFSIVDVVGVLTESVDAKDYWYRLKKRESEFSDVELSTFCRQLKLKSSDGKKYLTDCSNKQGLFRIIQSIPSKKAEPFKLWLAKVGSERIDEIENPELAQERMKALYEEKGYPTPLDSNWEIYPTGWIEKRVRGIAIRQDLTDSPHWIATIKYIPRGRWEQRGIKDKKDYAILTNEIAKATFGVSIGEHKLIKGLEPKFKNQNLRDHMTDLELIFGMPAPLDKINTTLVSS